MDKKSLIFPIENKDWLFQIAGLYQKGKIELYLCPIPNLNTPVTQLKPLTKANWESALNRAQKLLKTGARSPKQKFPPAREEGFHDPDSGKGGD